MKQLLLFLQIGVACSLLMSTDCGRKPNGRASIYYVFNNKTDFEIHISDHYVIAPQGILRDEDSGIRDFQSSTDFSLPFYSLDTLIKYIRTSVKETRCQDLNAQENISGHPVGIKDRSRYDFILLGNNQYGGQEYQVTYTFTQADVDAAQPCDLNVLELEVVNETSKDMMFGRDGVDIASNTSKTFEQIYERKEAVFRLPAGRALEPMTDTGIKYRNLYEDAAGSKKPLFLGFKEKSQVGWRRTSNGLSDENGQRCLLLPAGAAPFLDDLDNPNVFEKEVLSDRHVRYTYRITKAIEAQAVPCGEVRY